jgi:hypothetical protein
MQKYLPEFHLSTEEFTAYTANNRFYASCVSSSTTEMLAPSANVILVMSIITFAQNADTCTEVSFRTKRDTDF